MYTYNGDVLHQAECECHCSLTAGSLRGARQEIGNRVHAQSHTATVGRSPNRGGIVMGDSGDGGGSDIGAVDGIGNHGGAGVLTCVLSLSIICSFFSFSCIFPPFI